MNFYNIAALVCSEWHYIRIIGPSTGVIELQPAEIRVDLASTDKAVKGEKCSIAVPERLRRSDKVYIFE